MEDIVNKMLERINYKIKYAVENFEGFNEIHNIWLSEITGMVDMLSIVTGKNYAITENGLEERSREGWFMTEKGWTITFVQWDDIEGKERVVGRFKTTKEKDEFLEKIYKPNSGWLEEEFQTLKIINDYHYMLAE